MMEENFDSRPSERMEGFMLIRKTKLDKKSTLPSFSTSMIANQKRYFSIRAGILYQYERKTSREMMDRFKISMIKALDKKCDNDQWTLRMIYKKFYVIFRIESEQLADKWLKSLQQVKDRSDEYVYNAQTNLKRYAQMEKAFNRITGKSVFKDYTVLLERFEIRTMQQIWMKSHIYMLAMFSKGILGDPNNPAVTDQ